MAHVLLFFVQLIYAANYTVAKEIMPDFIAPLGLVLARVSFGVLFFTIFHQLFIKETIQKQDFKLLMLCGLFGVAINQMMFLKGLNWTTPINASLIMTTTPILVLVASALYLKEKITLNKVLGILLGAIGAILLITAGSSQSAGLGKFGDLLIFINATSYGIYLVLVKSLLEKYHPFTVIRWVFTIGLVYVFPFGFGELSSVDWSVFTPMIWAALAFVLVFVTILTYLFNAVSLSTLNASTVSFYIYFQPLLAALIALVFSKDELTWIKIVAGILIFVGVYLVSNRKPNVNE